MKAVRVWIRRIDGTAVLRVDSLENAKWLLCKLSDFFVFKTSEPLHNVADSSDCIFRVAHSSRLPGARLEELLVGIAEVNLASEPGL
jgi:hypothetical protein